MTKIIKPLVNVEVLPISSPESLYLGESSIVLPPAPDTISYPELILLRNPYGYWRGEEDSGNIAIDSGTGGNNGSYIGAYTLNQSGIIDEGVCPLYSSSAKGDDAGITVGNCGGHQFGYPITVEAWCNIPDLTNPAFRFILATHTNVSEYRGIQIGINSAGSVACTCGDGNGNGSFNADLYSRYGYTDSGVIQSGINHHIVVVIESATNMKFYIDDDLKTTIYAGSGSIDTDFTSLNNNLTIGWSNSSTVPTYANAWFFNGRLDEVILYEFALTADDVHANFIAGTDDL